MGFVRDQEFRKFFYSDPVCVLLTAYDPHGRNYKSSK